MHERILYNDVDSRNMRGIAYTVFCCYIMYIYICMILLLIHSGKGRLVESLLLVTVSGQGAPQLYTTCKYDGSMSYSKTSYNKA